MHAAGDDGGVGGRALTGAAPAGACVAPWIRDARLSFHTAEHARECVESTPSDSGSSKGPRWVGPKQPFASDR